MSTFSSVLLGICITAATGGIINLLAPTGNTGKNVKMAVTVFMLLSICTSVSSVWKNADIQTIKSEESFYENAGEIVEDNVRNAVIKITKDILEKEKVVFSKVEAETYISDENEILVSKIIIYGANKNEVQETADEITEKTGAEVCVFEAS